MHSSDQYQDLSSLSNSAYSSNLLGKSNTLTTKKRTRRKSTGIFSQKEEERMLKYALKLSEKEFLQQKQRGTKKKKIENEINTINFFYKDIPECDVIYATLEDFKNPIGFIEKLWNQENLENTGLIKIIPPKEWKDKQKSFYLNEIKERIHASDKPLITRKQNLGLLYQAKVGYVLIKKY